MFGCREGASEDSVESSCALLTRHPSILKQESKWTRKEDECLKGLSVPPLPFLLALVRSIFLKWKSGAVSMMEIGNLSEGAAGLRYPTQPKYLLCWLALEYESRGKSLDL